MNLNDEITQACIDTGAEKRLVARLQAGEAEAMNALFNLHVDRVFAYARHMLGNREDAEDAALEAFRRAFERISSYRAECPFRGWLFSITRNICLDRLRQPALWQLETDEAERQSDEGAGAQEMTTRAMVAAAMAGLPTDYQMVLKLCDVEQWDARECAEMLGKTRQATKSILYRARRALRERLMVLWEEENDDAL